MNDDDLIVSIRARALNADTRVDTKAAEHTHLYPLATPEVIAATEQALGFSLHPFLCRLYREIANGGFGPGYGLTGLAGGHRDVEGAALVARYHEFRAGPWPDRLLPLWDWGDAIWSCLDGSSPEGVIITHYGANGQTA